MKKILSLLSFIIIISIYVTSCENTSFEDSTLESIQNKEDIDKTDNCATIISGDILYPVNHYLGDTPYDVGFDIYGHNYQSHSFDGSYANLYLGEAGFPPYLGDDDAYLIENPEVENNSYIMNYFWPYRNTRVLMNWNDARWSNKDCDGDGLLDRHFGFDTYQGSGAWETFQSKGVYFDEDGSECNFNYKYKYVAPPIDAYQENGFWYTADGNEIGTVWYYFANVQIIAIDPCGDMKGLLYKNPLGPGLGIW